MDAARAGGQLEFWPEATCQDVERIPIGVEGVGRWFIVASAGLKRIIKTARRMAASATPVLLLGESGVGKNLIAWLTHWWSTRRNGPFTDLGAASMPETLLESEFFGHEKGAFTGSCGAKPGRLEQAQGGTLFLDEVGDLTPALQIKLLRVLEEGTFERVGGTEKRMSDARIVLATHQDLKRLVALGKFRKDLFYRINALPLRIPSLRERREEIPALAEAFAETFPGSPSIHPEALRLLESEGWPGNIRELRNWVQSMGVFDDDGVLGPDDFLKVKQHYQEAFQSDADGDGLQGERKELLAKLEESGWRIGETADRMGITPRHLNRKMKVLGITRKVQR